ncbi:MAG TPA: sensor histidine kinase [Gammaproteobacteria bacterium]|nr:sensor histidine kinase [Gammaproteobacteria bacterium]
MVWTNASGWIVANSRRLGAWAALALLVTGVVQAQTLELGSSSGLRGLAPVIRYVTLPGTPHSTLPQARTLPSSAFAPLDARYVDFGYTPDTIWLRLELHNAGAEAGRWLLSLNVRFMTEIVVYKGGDASTVLLNQTERSTFLERPIRHRYLAVPFSLSAGERTELLIGYSSKGTTAMPISIETPESYAERYAREDAINIAAYAALTFVIFLTLFQSLAFRQAGQLRYALYLGATLAYILHMDGVTFQYVWPRSPLWNSYAAVPLGLAMSVAALMFARGFAETKRLAPLYDKIMLAMIAAAVVVSFGGLIVDEARVKGIAFLLASSTAALCLGAGVLAYRRKRSAMRFFVIGWIGVFVGVFLWSIANNLPALMPRTAALPIPKLTLMFDTLMFSMALADRSRRLRIERDLALRRELDALQAQQRITQQLHDAERERLEALLVAEARSQQLAMTSHDIRQPLVSLRLTLERLSTDTRFEPMAASFKQSIDYLDWLSEEYTTGSTSVDAAPAADESVFDVAMVLENVDLMFRDEARAKGLRLRRRSRSVEVCGDAMATMRIVSNLVANAVKYTRAGKILVGCRRRPGRVTLVVADTGPGIPADELERVLKVYERGSAADGTEGQGLGLGIASKLAAQQGFGFRCLSTPGRGTAFFVDVPRAAPAAADDPPARASDAAAAGAA